MAAVSLGTRLALTIGLVFTILSALLFIELTSRERDAIMHSKEVAAANVADLFASGVSAALDFSDVDAIDASIKDFASSYDVTCAAVWQGDDTKPIAAFRNERCSELLAPHDDALGRTAIFPDRVEVARSVNAHGRRVGRALLVFSLARENDAVSSTRSRLLAIFAGLTGGSAVLLVLVVRRQIVTPVTALVNAARRVAMGDYKAHVDVASRDEIGVLSRSFNSMGAAIADREDRLEAVTRSLRELFGAMQQIIVAFDVEGRVDGEASRAARKLFGNGEPLVGKDIRQLLYPPGRDHGADAKAFKEWLAAAFDLPPDRWDELAALAPTEVVIHQDSDARILEMEFRPIVQGDQTRRVMLFATDVTEERRLKKTVRDQQAEHERRMAAMRRLLAGGGQVFVAFLDGSKERAQRATQLATEGARSGHLTSAQIDELFRHAHTIKGEARAFDLPELEQAAQSVEAELERLRNDARSGTVPGAEAQKLLPLIERVKSEIERAGDVFVAASPVGRAALDRITVQRQDITDLLEWVRTSERAMPAMRKGGPLSKLVTIADRIGSRPFGESTLLLVEAAPTWAEREGKKVRIEVQGRDVHVPAKLTTALAPALVHLVRNAIAHGIEAPAVRSERKKSDVGIVKLVATESAAGPSIVVEDDGGGLDRKKIMERAEELDGAEAASVAELIFAPGFSTAGPQSTIAGRGVGLGAVREELLRAGYAIEVHTQAEKGTRFVISPVKM